ncbi:efflux RND transporter periplasmic adaptor subunit [Actimicrobium antarcticum]|uniref:Efflux RND transporter periplasmic adaptor subunit n=1 Tax=Actimicrobium antarcticum TaxID=1051899 RepID=A0ABP7T469_9BURK
MMKRLTLSLLALSSLSAPGFANAADDKKAGPAKPALSVTTTRPTRISVPIQLSANGNITAWQEAVIGSESNGLRLTDVQVNVGDKVRAGQVLARFSAESTNADVAQARASLMEAQASAADASGNAARARTLQDTGALSTQQINQYLTTEQTAKARVAAAKATLDVQQLRLKHTRLIAPDNGIISARSATVGAVVPAGTELFRMIRQGRLEWRAEVTSTELGRIAPGMAATVTAANGSKLNGKVRMIAPTVDLQNRTALVYVDLVPASANSAPAKAGMFARGEFDLGSSTALTVPQQSVVIRDGFSYVFRLNADNRVSQLKVPTGRRLADRVEVRDGLTPETLLVVSGAGFLNDGDLVKAVAAEPVAAVPVAAIPAAAAAK